MTAAAERAPVERARIWKSGSRWQRHAPELIVAFATVLAAVLALYRLDNRSLWLDEATTYYVSSVSWSRLLEVVSGDATGWHPPTYFLALKAWRVFGDSQVALRSFSVLFAVLTIPMVFLVARRLISQYAAAVASLLMACNAFFIQYAQEARTYALTMFLATASYFLFIRAVDGVGRARWLAYSVVCLLGIYSHIFFGLLVAAQMLSLGVPGLRPKRVDAPLIAYGVVAALSLPLLAASLGQSGALLEWIDPIAWSTIVDWFRDVAGGTDGLLLAYGLGSLLAIVWAVGPGRRPSWFWLVLLWALVPPLGLAAVSLAKPVFLSRYLIITLPAVVMLVAAGITRLPAWAAGVFVIILLLASTSGIRAWHATTPKQWDVAVTHMETYARPGDGVVIWRRSWFKPLAYQVMRLVDAEDRPTLASPALPWNHNPYGRGPVPVTSAAQRLSECSFRRLWLVGGPRRLRDQGRGEQRVLAPILRGAYEEVDDLSLGRLRLQLYERNDSRCPARS